MADYPWGRPRHAAYGEFVHTQPADTGDVLALPALWRAHLEYLLIADDGKPHKTLTPWEIETLAYWHEYRPDHILTPRQCKLFRRIVEAARKYDAAVARWAREAERRG
jgi:hypothetical protein